MKSLKSLQSLLQICIRIKLSLNLSNWILWDVEIETDKHINHFENSTVSSINRIQLLFSMLVILLVFFKPINVLFKRSLGLLSCEYYIKQKTLCSLTRIWGYARSRFQVQHNRGKHWGLPVRHHSSHQSSQLTRLLRVSMRHKGHFYFIECWNQLGLKNHKTFDQIC